ncbi:hypothetical protein PHYC_01265 [Phycisphaerales bacterium]|nr:hypothetical protein PHYC_01265 [Phycisphaerales bacterium]
MNTPGFIAAFPALFLCACTLAQPNYGIDFVTVGSPGNRATLPSEIPWRPDVPMGSVGYQYRMAREPLSVAQYLEFANAYGAHVTNFATVLEVSGRWLGAAQQPDGTWRFAAPTDWMDLPAGTSWEMAARYCNWIQNGQSGEAWAFESGVYDTSTFIHTSPPPHQITPAPGARFWIPSLDEFVKATHYDPNRYGPGQDGYWQYPNSSDSPLREGLPEDGGETIGDLLWQGGGGRFLGEWPLGQYPGTQTPWGLVDVSGVLHQWTSAPENPSVGTMWTGGSMAGSFLWYFDDRIDYDGVDTLWTGQSAIRLASTVPSPGALTMQFTALAVSCVSWRRRR